MRYGDAGRVSMRWNGGLKWRSVLVVWLCVSQSFFCFERIIRMKSTGSLNQFNLLSADLFKMRHTLFNRILCLYSVVSPAERQQRC